MKAPETKQSFLEFLPVSLFGSILGLTGLSYSLELAEKKWGFSLMLSSIIGGMSILFFLILFILYLVKIWKYPSLVKAEFKHPVSVSFFGIFIICLLLLPGIILPYSIYLAAGTWAIGAVIMFLFAWFVLRKWLDQQQEPGNAMPAWIIPVVGTLDVPIVGHRLPITGIKEICLLFFGIGILFSVILLVIIFSRLLFQPPLPEALKPTLMILIGPLALAFSGYESLSGSQDIIASILYYSDLFLLLLFGSKIFLLPKCCPFRVSWWAVSFPLVACTIASFRYSANKQSIVYQFIPTILLIISTCTIAYLLVQTFYKIFTNKLFLSNPLSEKATRQLEPFKSNSDPVGAVRPG
ncbi:MAG: SLAC1 anion channel family protein [Ginsengibacter sp.]